MERREALKMTSLLLGYTLGGSALVILDGCKSEPQLNWTPQFFSPENILIIADVAEIILPKTTTPGAKDAQCEKYIDAAVFGFYTKEKQDKFVKDLEIFQDTAKNKFSKSFLALNENEKEKVVEIVVNDMKSKSEDEKHIFKTLKELTIMGYCTSEVGATGGLFDFRPVPGPYQGCIDYATVGKTWAI